MRILPEDRLILDAVAAQERAMIDRTVDWCAIGSGSRNIDGLERQRLALVDAARALPAQVDSVPLPASLEIGADGEERPVVHPDAIRITARPDAPVQVVLTGHYDTVYPADSAFQTVRTRDDGALWGPGVADMKGGISVMLAALEAFERHPAREALGWTVLLSPDEEIGSLASAPLLAELGRRGHVGLTYEPAMGDGALAAARKGSGNFHIVVRGKAAHAGRDFASGRNAVAGAAAIASALHALNGRREEVTVNIGTIAGGGPLNVVPDTAVVRFNVRVPDAAGAAWIEAQVQAILATPPFDGLTLRLHGGFTRPPKPFDASQAALFEAVRDAGALLGQAIAWKPSGGVCEGNNLHAAGLPNLDTLGVRGGDIHSEAEHAWPDSFVERAQLSALILCKIASGDIDARRLKALRLETL